MAAVLAGLAVLLQLQLLAASIVKPGAPPPEQQRAYLPVPQVLGVPLNVTVDWFTGSRHLFETLLLRPLEQAAAAGDASLEVTARAEAAPLPPRGADAAPLPPQDAGAAPLAPGLTFVEIGSLEGLSARWLGDMVLSRSRGGVLHCIDTFGGGEEHQGDEWFGQFLGQIEQRFNQNVGALMAAGTVVKHRGLSRVELARLLTQGGEATVDFTYVDGSHAAVDVLGDALLSFWLTKVGGVIAFDDYEWRPDLAFGWDTLKSPKPALDAFLTVFLGRLEVLHKGYQLWVRRVA